MTKRIEIAFTNGKNHIFSKVEKIEENDTQLILEKSGENRPGRYVFYRDHIVYWREHKRRHEDDEGDWLGRIHGY